jgi:hypothetical protein
MHDDENEYAKRGVYIRVCSHYFYPANYAQKTANKEEENKNKNKTEKKRSYMCK